MHGTPYLFIFPAWQTFCQFVISLSTLKCNAIKGRTTSFLLRVWCPHNSCSHITQLHAFVLKINMPPDFSLLERGSCLPFAAAGSDHFSPKHLNPGLNEAPEILSGCDYMTLIATNIAWANHNIVLWLIAERTLIRDLITYWNHWKTCNH